MSTRAGWIGGEEVVEVEFDPRRVTFESLLKRGQLKQCARRVFALSDRQAAAAKKAGASPTSSDGTVRTASDLKYHLRQTSLRHVPMTPMQAARANSEVRSAEGLLSPSQREILATVRAAPDRAWPIVIGMSLQDGYAAIAAAQAKD